MKLSMLSICLLLGVFVGGCGTKYSRTYTETLNEDGEREATSRVDYTYNSKNPEGQVRQAKTEMSEGNYAAAAKRLESIYANKDLEEELRAESLLQLGNLNSNVLNRDKDYGKAAQFYRQLIDEFPDSEWVISAEEGLRKIAAIQEEL